MSIDNQILDLLEEQYKEKLKEMETFLVEQIDRFLAVRSSEFLSAVRMWDVDQMEAIRTDAHRMLDAAFDYKMKEV